MNTIKSLVVDDDPLYRQSVAKVLDTFNCRYTLCANGAIAEKAMAADPTYNLIITDILMPEVDGLELSKIIRKNYSAENIYIIAMSSGATSISIRLALSSAKLYVNDTIAKPFTKGSLLEMLEKAIVFLGTAHCSNQ